MSSTRRRIERLETHLAGAEERRDAAREAEIETELGHLSDEQLEDLVRAERPNTAAQFAERGAPSTWSEYHTLARIEREALDDLYDEWCADPIAFLSL